VFRRCDRCGPFKEACAPYRPPCENCVKDGVDCTNYPNGHPQGWRS
jgi:hypothetical protein